MRITESKLRRIIREELDETHDHAISKTLERLRNRWGDSYSQAY
jgi:hypothetical protein